MTRDNPIEIPYFNCIVQFKRDTVPKSGVAIYQNNNNVTNIMTPNIEDVSDVNIRRSFVGDICACLCKLRNGLHIVMVAIYISPNPKLDEVEHFIHRILLEYTEEGSKILGTNGNKFPLILAGDFNINFANKKSVRLSTFLSEKLNLKINNDPQESTTKYGTTIDAVLSRYLEDIKSQTYVSYFSYHKPIVSMIKIPE